MPTVVIAAHNEQNVIGATLDALLQQSLQPGIDIVVSANGCTDDTVTVAQRRGVTVIDRVEPGKAAALNAAEQFASGFPRVYLDADIVVPPDGLAKLLAGLHPPAAALAVYPRRAINTVGRPWPVRAYFAINERLPVFRHGLFGRGLIVLSERGRARFDEFPLLVADDLFLDSLFTDAEKTEVSSVEVLVEAPFSTRELVRRLVRVRRGNAELRASASAGEVGGVRPADRWSWLRDVVMPEPRLIAHAVAYVAISVTAELLARRAGTKGQHPWGRDESTRRQAAAENGAGA